MSEIQRADSGARRRAMLIVVGAGVLGMFLIPLADAYRGVLTEWLQADPSRASSRLMLVASLFAIGALVPALGFSAYLYRAGAAIVRAERFPAPGTRVTRDTPVLRDAAARRHGRTVQLVAVLLAIAAAGLALALWKAVETLVAPPA